MSERYLAVMRGRLIIGLASVFAVVALLVLPTWTNRAAITGLVRFRPSIDLVLIVLCFVSALPLPRRTAIFRATILTANLAVATYAGMLLPIVIGLSYFLVVLAAGLAIIPRLTGRGLDVIRLFAIGCALVMTLNVAVWEALHPPLWSYALIPGLLAGAGLMRWSFERLPLIRLGWQVAAALEFALPVYVYSIIDTSVIAHSDSAAWVFNFGFLYDAARSFVLDDVSVSPVYFYGKFLEVLMLPLFQLEWYPVLTSFAAGPLVVMAVAVRFAARKLGVGGRAEPLFFAAIVTSPSVMFALRGITPDFFALALVSSAFLLATVETQRRSDPANFLYASAFMIMTLATKPSWIPIGLAAGGVLFVSALYRARYVRRIARSDAAIFVLCLMPAVLCILRNMISLGLPLVGPPEFATLLGKFGIVARSDIYAIPELDIFTKYFRDVGVTLRALLRNDPAEYHLWMAWPSTVLAAYALAVLGLHADGTASIRLSRSLQARVIASITFTVVAAMIYRLLIGPTVLRGGAGYYYNGPIFLTLFACVLLWRVRVRGRGRAILTAVLGCFLILNMALGTLLRPLDYVLPSRSGKLYQTYIIDANAMSNIAAALRATPRCHMIYEFGNVEKSPSPWAMNQLPCFNEANGALMWPKRSGLKIFASGETLRDFACKSRVTHLMLYRENNWKSRHFHTDIGKAFATNELDLIAEEANLQLFKLNRAKACG